MLSTLRHGLDMVEALSGGPMSVAELSARLDLSRQTAYRVAATLVEANWVAYDRSSNEYRLTARLWSIGTSAFDDADLRTQWGPVVKKLALLGETVHLSIYDHGEVIYIDKADGTHPVRAYTQLGGRAPAHCVATGKVLLAHSDPAERDRVLQGPLAAPTKRTVATQAKLTRQLAEVRRRGYAVNHGEWRDGVGGVAVPLRNRREEVVAALGFSAPLGRLVQRQKELLRVLFETADGTTT